MPLGLRDDASRSRYAMYRPPSMSDRILWVVRDYFGIAVTLLAAYLGWNALLDHTNIAIGRNLHAIPMPRQSFDALVKQETPWEFHFLNAGEEQLVLRHLVGDGPQRVRATYDRFTDGKPPFNADLPPSSVAPLFRAVTDQAGEFFAGEERWAMRTMRYRRPADWPFRPLFFFQTAGPQPHERYILAFGGGTEGTLESCEERVLAAVRELQHAVVQGPSVEPVGTPAIEERLNSSPGR